MKNKWIVAFCFQMLACSAFGQASEKFEEGYFIDKNNQKFSGFLKLEPGDGKKPGQLSFRESRTGKKETYQPGYIKAFVIRTDSFSVLKNIPLGHKKSVPSDFVRVVLVGSGGTLCQHEVAIMKSTGHASTEFRIEEEKLRYFLNINNKLILLTPSNMKDFATVIADHEELKKRVLARKVKHAQLLEAVDEYKRFKAGQTASQ